MPRRGCHGGGLMKPIASYLRHAITAGVLLLLAKYKFPLEGADMFADAIALGVIGTVTWLIVKYLPEFAKTVGLLAICLMSLPSCTPGEMPIRAAFLVDGGQIGYSSKGGLTISVDAQSGK